MFTAFLNKDKFEEEPQTYYSGVADGALKSILTNKINEAATIFEKISRDENPSEDKYQDAIKQGLDLFSDISFDLDTEERERICCYFEELMVIAGVESSNGKLNMFLYGFEPGKLIG